MVENQCCKTNEVKCRNVGKAIYLINQNEVKRKEEAKNICFDFFNSKNSLKYFSELPFQTRKV